MSNEGMTQARWDGLNTAEREHGRSTFWVGRTTGWKPCHLAMRAGAYGSSDAIRVDEVFYRVDVLGKARR